MDGYNKFYYENGVLSSEGYMRNGKPDGYWKTYHLNGKIKSEGNRKEYELDSLWKFYNDDGKISVEINYRKGKKDGMRTSWTEGKYIVQEDNFSSDVKQGFSFIYFPPEDTLQQKGKIKMKIHFDRGKENGTAYEYDDKGNIITIFYYSYGVLKKQERINRTDSKGQKQGVWKEFYGNGMVKEETTYINNKKSGYSKKFTETGSLIVVEKYIGDSLQQDAPEIATKLEVRNEYYPDGKIKKTGTWLYGVEEGMHKTYSEEGEILLAKIYKEGKIVEEGKLNASGNKEGEWSEYHLAGQLKGKGNYQNGKRTGEWIFYHPNGKVEQKGVYDSKGRAQGVWKWYYESGNLLREENYLDGKREGIMTEWSDSTGKIITQGNYFDGMKEGKWIYEIQEYREEGNYKNDQKDGYWKSYYNDNKKLRFEGAYIEGIPDGEHTYYYHDGRLREAGKYVAGNKEGNWIFYNPDGTPLITIYYKRNREVKFDGTKVKPLLPGENIK